MENTVFKSSMSFIYDTAELMSGDPHRLLQTEDSTQTSAATPAIVFFKEALVSKKTKKQVWLWLSFFQSNLIISSWPLRGLMMCKRMWSGHCISQRQLLSPIRAVKHLPTAGTVCLRRKVSTWKNRKLFFLLVRGLHGYKSGTWGLLWSSLLTEEKLAHRFRCSRLVNNLRG